MAHVIGYPARKDVKKSIFKLCFLLSIAILAAVLAYDPTGHRLQGLYSSIAVGMGLSLAMLFVYMRVDPMGFKRLVMPKAFETHINQDLAVADILSNLSQSTFVFHNFIFELFHVEHLVVSRQGIFVISKIRESGDLHIKNDTLFCGRYSLETITANTWRISHLVSILLKKYFQTDYLPQPVLIVPDSDTSSISEFKGMALVRRRDLNAFIERRIPSIEQETAMSFSGFITRRYPSRI